MHSTRLLAPAAVLAALVVAGCGGGGGGPSTTNHDTMTQAQAAEVGGSIGSLVAGASAKFDLGRQFRFQSDMSTYAVSVVAVRSW